MSRPSHVQVTTSPSYTAQSYIQAQKLPQNQYIWLLTGPAGSGKSTVGQYLANATGMPYIEGDDYHPKANVDKMSHGTPLTDVDRWDWLVSLREASLQRLAAGHQGVVLTCSALKRKYRDVIRVAPNLSHNVHVHFFYLNAPENVLQARVKNRIGHYMGAEMVHSQLSILEAPDANEIDVSLVDVSRPINQIGDEVLSKICGVIQESAKG